jgi:hypothetical protein
MGYSYTKRAGPQCGRKNKTKQNKYRFCNTTVADPDILKGRGRFEKGDPPLKNSEKKLGLKS